MDALTSMPLYPLSLELNVEAGDNVRFKEVALEWLDDGSRLLDAPLRSDVDAESNLPFREPDDPESPWGPPNGVWGALLVHRLTEMRMRPHHSRRPASTNGWRWLRRHLDDPPFAAQVMLRRLGDDGHPIALVDLMVMAHSSAPGWIRLSKTLSSGPLTREDTGRREQQRWLQFLRSYADRLNPAYGQIGELHNLDETALERCLPTEYGRNKPWNTIQESRQHLRGYPWLTIIAEELAARIGGPEAIRRTGVFHEVATMDCGGVWLRATEDLRSYDLAKAAQVFRVLAPILRPGLPSPPRVDARTGVPNPWVPFLLVYEDASAVRVGGEKG